MPKITVTISATMTSGDNDDVGEDRGLDLELDAGVNMRAVLALVFEDAVKRIEAAGIKVYDATNFT